MRHALIAFLKKVKKILIYQFRQYDEKLPYIITSIITLIVVIAGINLFVELTDTLKNELMAGYDQQVTSYVISFRNPALTKYFVFITNVGDLYGYLIVIALTTLISFVIFKQKKYVGQIILVLALASVSNMILKRFINRARPGIEHMVSVETLSYPSGHAMSAMAFYGFLIYLFYTFKMNKILKILAIIILAILILSIGISRIYLGVHFPSDIAGGYLAGLIWVFFCIMIFNLIKIFRRDPET